MAECFCGCGHKVAFSRRPMNTSGRRVSDALARIDAWTKPLYEETGTPPRNLIEFQTAGQVFRDQLAEITHGTRHPRDFDRPSMRRWLKIAWQAEPTALAGAVGVAMREPLPDAPSAPPGEHLVRELDEQLTRLSVAELHPDVELVLTTGTMAMAPDLVEALDRPFAVSFTRLGYLMRELEHQYLGADALKGSEGINSAVTAILVSARAEDGGHELPGTSYASGTAQVLAETPYITDEAPGFDRSIRARVCERFVEAYCRGDVPAWAPERFRLLFRFGFCVHIVEDAIAALDEGATWEEVPERPGA